MGSAEKITHMLEVEGLSRSEVAKKMKCTPRNISSYIKRYGIKFNKAVGAKHHSWKGGRVKGPNGYMFVYDPDHPRSIDKYVKEHFLVMEQHLGRKLLPCEKVFHINKDRTDNRIENLRLSSIGNEVLSNEVVQHCPRCRH